MKTLLFLFLLLPVYAKVSEIEVVAAVIVAEAGGEGRLGMQAVASVIQNRTTGRTLSPYAVVTKPWQFSCVNGLKTYDEFVNKAMQHPRWSYALELSKQVRNKKTQDVTGGATHYHADYVTPRWEKELQLTRVIGRHFFYR